MFPHFVPGGRGRPLTSSQVNLGNARTLNNDIPSDNIVTELGLTGNRYNIAVAVFFVP